jgi:hypothetical protein
MVLVLLRQGREDCPLSWGGVLQFVDHDVFEAIRDRPADVGAVVEELVEGQEDVAAVEGAGVGEDLVVGGHQLGEVGICGLRAGLQLVDLFKQAGQETRRVATDVVVAEGEVVEVVEQHRQPLGRAEYVEEGIEPGRGRVLAQEPLVSQVPIQRSS